MGTQYFYAVLTKITGEAKTTEVDGNIIGINDYACPVAAERSVPR
jgi:hypothetical protein